jgi:hypothetical protein
MFVPGSLSLLSRYSPRYLISSWGSCTLFIWTGEARFSPCGECYVDRLGFVGFNSPFFYTKSWIANRSVFSFCVAMAGSLSWVTSAILSANIALVDSGEVRRSAVYSRYNNGPRTLPWGTPALIDDCSVYSGSVCYVNRFLG